MITRKAAAAARVSARRALASLEAMHQTPREALVQALIAARCAAKRGVRQHV